ncbi:chromate transporter [Mycoplasmopsis maculosa]|uniref:Chromate transporter n=1 Tax=Mycoplasmopsis maculosa TaxID=114885 RepID=A0A449B4L6_9BACT|nr:chromate transporter [Mycoplasmopsis maculosa]VEU75553.1 chromate transporter [Mycoplasmopsis maculosa]
MSEIRVRKDVSFWKVFWFIILSTFIGFGGGNALFPILKRYSVDKYKWLSEKEFEENVLITNMLPGPSVIEALSYISFKMLGFWKGLIVVIFAVIPHVLLAFLLIYFSQYIEKKYLYVIEVGVMITIIGSLIIFVLNYYKKGIKGIKISLWFILFLTTFLFTLFIPAPYNMPVGIMILVIIIFSLIYFAKKCLNKEKEVKK